VARPAASAPGEQALERLTASIARRTHIRFTTSAAALAARIVELSAAAGAAPKAHLESLVLDDLYLATACAAGDRDAWRECEAAHFSFIRSFARRFLPDAPAQDLADQVIADLWQRGKIGRYAGRSTLRTWLGAVVAHAAINARKSPPPGVASHADALREYTQRNIGATRQLGPEDSQAERVLADLIVRAIQALNPEEKLLLQLHYEQGLTLQEMEGPLASSKATLSRRLKGIREQVKARIDEMAETMLDTSVAVLRERLTLDRLEFDLSASLRTGAPMEKKGPDSV
jgi:RNA polymerase sigma factor (sigma-70 family)